MASDSKPANSESESAADSSPFDAGEYQEYMALPPEEQAEMAAAGLHSRQAAKPDMDVDLRGRRLGSYALLEPLGRRGLATVYRARQPAMQRDVAVKVLPPRFSRDPNFAAQFRAEAELVAQLDHPNILPIYDFDQEDGYAYIVSRYVPTGSLHDRLDSGPLPPDVALEIAEHLSAALSHAHARGVVHRDVKPSNVLLDDERAYLTDFGIAAVLQSQRAMPAEADDQLGTPGYIAPEQVRGDLLDARADVYSMGALVYEMLTGRPPLAADAPAAASTESSWYRSDAPPAVVAVLRKAMSSAPDNRYDTAAAFIDALREAYAAAPEEWRAPTDDAMTPQPAASPAGSLSHLAEPPDKPIIADELRRAGDDDAEVSERDRAARRRRSSLLSGSEGPADERPALRQLVDQPGGVGFNVKATQRSIWPDAPPVGASAQDQPGNGLVISGVDFARRIRAKYGFESAPGLETTAAGPERWWQRLAARIPLLDTGRRFLTTALAVGAVLVLFILLTPLLERGAPAGAPHPTAAPVTAAAPATPLPVTRAPTSVVQPTATAAAIGLPSFDLPVVDIEPRMQHFGWQSAGDGDQIYDLALSEGYIWAATGAGLFRWDTAGKFTHFASEHGLASNRARALAIQPDGTLWVGTLDSGLSRYAGSDWQTFTIADGLPGNAVYALALDPAGGLWVGTDNGLGRYDGAAWQTFSVEQGAGSQVVKDLAVDPNGDVWAVTAAGVARPEGETLATVVDGETLRTTAITSIGVDAAGMIWVGTEGNGVARYDGDSWERFVGVGFEQATVRHISADGEGNLWVASDSGLHRFDGEKWTTFTTEDGLPGDDLWAVAFHPETGLWAGGRAGLARQDGDRWQPFVTGDGLTSNAVQALDFGSRGQVWIGLLDGGLATFTGNAWRSYGVEDGLAGLDVWSLLVDDEDTVWAGTIGGGLSRFNDAAWHTFSVQNGLAGNDIWTVTLDPKGKLWVTTSDRGAFILDGETFIPQSVTSAGEPWALDFGADSSQWMGTFDGEVVRDAHAPTVWAPIPNQGASPSDKVLTVLVDDVNRVWLGTVGGGVLMFNGARWENFTVDDGLAANTVWAIAAGPGNSIWFGTPEGITVYNGTSWRSFSTDSGLAAKEVRTLGVAPDGRLWIGTSGGLSIVDPDSAQLYR